MAANKTDKRKRELVTLIIVFTLVLLVSALVVYLIAGRTTSRSDSVRDAQVPTTSSRDSTAGPVTSPRDSLDQTPTPYRRENEPPGFIAQLFGNGSSDAYDPNAHWTQNIGKITFRLILAAILGAALAFRPRKELRVLKRNPYVSQTQILLAIVAAALMIIVGDNAARAFGIFAAVSLVRFRTNIRDPKEITVLLISLALGLASGVGRYELALILVVFSIIVLWLLEWRETTEVFRALAVKICTRNVASTQRALRQVLEQHGFDSELRGLEREHDDGSAGYLVYSVDVSPTVSTDQLSEDVLSIDERNIDSITWEQKKSYSYLYQ
jgi:uncharacterized membrane protein YhiD involved in acid resistance